MVLRFALGPALVDESSPLNISTRLIYWNQERILFLRRGGKADGQFEGDAMNSLE